MKCPKCSYVSTHKKDACSKCHCDLRPRKRELGVAVVYPTLSLQEIINRQGDGMQPKVDCGTEVAKERNSSAGQKKGGWLSRIISGKKEAEGDTASPTAPSTRIPQHSTSQSSSPFRSAAPVASKPVPPKPMVATPPELSKETVEPWTSTDSDFLKALGTVTTSSPASSLRSVQSAASSAAKSVAALSDVPAVSDDDLLWTQAVFLPVSTAGTSIDEPIPDTDDSLDRISAENFEIESIFLEDVIETAGVTVAEARAASEAEEEDELFAAISSIEQIQDEDEFASLDAELALPEGIIHDVFGFSPEPFIPPEVMEFGDEDELLEQQLDAFLEGSELSFEAVKIDRPSRQMCSSSMSNDDFEISLEFDGDDDDDEEAEQEDESLFPNLRMDNGLAIESSEDLFPFAVGTPIGLATSIPDKPRQEPADQLGDRWLLEELIEMCSTVLNIDRAIVTHVAQQGPGAIRKLMAERPTAAGTGTTAVNVESAFMNFVPSAQPTNLSHVGSTKLPGRPQGLMDWEAVVNAASDSAIPVEHSGCLTPAMPGMDETIGIRDFSALFSHNSEIEDLLRTLKHELEQSQRLPEASTEIHVIDEAKVEPVSPLVAAASESASSMFSVSELESLISDASGLETVSVIPEADGKDVLDELTRALSEISGEMLDLFPTDAFQNELVDEPSLPIAVKFADIAVSETQIFLSDDLAAVLADFEIRHGIESSAVPVSTVEEGESSAAVLADYRTRELAETTVPVEPEANDDGPLPEYWSANETDNPAYVHALPILSDFKVEALFEASTTTEGSENDDVEYDHTPDAHDSWIDPIALLEAHEATSESAVESTQYSQYDPAVVADYVGTEAAEFEVIEVDFTDSDAKVAPLTEGATDADDLLFFAQEVEFEQDGESAAEFGDSTAVIEVQTEQPTETQNFMSLDPDILEDVAEWESESPLEAESGPRATAEPVLFEREFVVLATIPLLDAASLWSDAQREVELWNQRAVGDMEISAGELGAVADRERIALLFDLARESVESPGAVQYTEAASLRTSESRVLESQELNLALDTFARERKRGTHGSKQVLHPSDPAYERVMASGALVRVCAMFLDMLFVSVVGSIAAIFMFGPHAMRAGLLEGRFTVDTQLLPLVGPWLLLSLGLWVLLSTILVWGTGQTLGQGWMQIVVLNDQGRGLSFRQSMLRSILTTLNVTTLGLASLGVFGRSGRTLADRLSGSFVTSAEAVALLNPAQKIKKRGVIQI